MKNHSFMYSGIPVEYTLYRKDVKNINIRINRNGEIHVSAPKRVPLAEVQSFVQKKGDWIIRTLAEAEQANSAAPDGGLYNGKSLYLLGREYRLKLENAEKNRFSVTEKEIIFSTPFLDNEEKIKKLYMGFLKTIAAGVFDSVIERMIALTKGEFCTEKPEISIKNMRTRWGSCNTQTGKINLNLQLIKANEQCIEQVVLHEMIHLKVRGHGADFYERIEKYMPDWKERKSRLDKMYKDGI